METVNPVIALTGLLMIAPVWAAGNDDLYRSGADQHGARFRFPHVDERPYRAASSGALADGIRLRDDLALFDDGVDAPGQSDAVLAWDAGTLRLHAQQRDTPEVAAREPGVFREGGEADAAGGLRMSRANRAADFGAVYRRALTPNSSVSGYLGVPGYPALGPTSSGMEGLFSLSELYAPFRSSWLYAGDLSAGVVTFGYAWRNFRFESSSFARRDPERADARQSFLKMDSQSRRLSFRPARDWMLQFSRGQLSSLDQLDPNGEIRRTTLSLTYSHDFSAGRWQSIVAWGRNSGKQRESTTGYLLETTLNLANQHAFFGRVEQVGSDELMRQNDSLPRSLFKVNKMTVGYSYKMRVAGPVQYDIGALMSKHDMPAAAMEAYGSDRHSYLMFLRMRLP